MKLGLLILRVVVGLLFAGHGLQKLTGAFGGPGLDNVEKTMAALEMHPAPRNARLVAFTETAGGVAVAIGAATPLASAGLIATMITAIRKVHLAKGLWSSGGGYEYNLVLSAALAAIVAEGPGSISCDALIGRKRWGIGVAIAVIAAGMVGSLGATTLGKRNAPLSPTDTAASDVRPAHSAADADAETGSDGA